MFTNKYALCGRQSAAVPLILLALFILAATSTGLADATIPKADKPGSKDHPLLKRYDGSFIVAYEHQSFTDFVLPVSRLERVPGRKDTHNNNYFEPKQKKPLEGAYTRLVYLIPANRSPLEVLRNYQQEVTQKGGKILFECKDVECGGNATQSSSGGGGDMSLAMFLFPQERIKDPSFSNGSCAMAEWISDQRYATAEIPAQAAHVSILTYSLKGDLYCKAFKGRTIAVIDIIEGKAREQKMITVTSDEMAKEISSSGSVALYGIHFDFNKADVKAESEPALAEIAKLPEEQRCLEAARRRPHRSRGDPSVQHGSLPTARGGGCQRAGDEVPDRSEQTHAARCRLREPRCLERIRRGTGEESPGRVGGEPVNDPSLDRRACRVVPRDTRQA